MKKPKIAVLLIAVTIMANTSLVSAKDFKAPDRECDKKACETFDKDTSTWNDFIKNVERLREQVEIVQKGMEENALKKSKEEAVPEKPDEMHGWLGVSVTDGSIEGIVDIKNGAFIDKITSDSPLYDVGIEEGDLITEIDGIPIPNAYNLAKRLKTTIPGEKIIITITTVNRYGRYKSTDYIVKVVEKTEVNLEELDKEEFKADEEYTLDEKGF